MMGILCISGIDTSGGSGISADIRACANIGISCYPVLSTIAVQTNERVTEVMAISTSLIKDQLTSALEMEPRAVKIGLLHNAEVINSIIPHLEQLAPMPVILDTVMTASSEGALVDDSYIDAFIPLIPLSTMITPNIPEAEMILGVQIRTDKDAEDACRALHALGARNVLLKGGHGDSDTISDILFDGSQFHGFENPRIAGRFRGTGCALSTLIAGHMSKGLDAPTSMRRSRSVLQREIEATALLSKDDHKVLFISNRGGTD